jgi:exosortase A-associated hydrolase 1
MSVADREVGDVAVAFDCAGAALVGILSLPERAEPRGVLIVVGGPQYRAGSHRQFTLLARALAADGIAAMRFDYRGMGDSEGDLRDFETAGEDLRAAIGEFMRRVPALRDVVLWGLCDGASAALLHAHGDARVAGMVLLNPWVRTTDGYARTTLRHYYLARLRDGDFWRKLLGGRFDVGAAARSFGGLVIAAARPASASASASASAPAAAAASAGAAIAQPQQKAEHAAALPQRMLAGLQRFPGRVLLIISGKDLTAQEFLDLTAASKPWQKLLAAPRVRRHTLPDADHTFSRAAWRDEVALVTAAWVRSW